MARPKPHPIAPRTSHRRNSRRPPQRAIIPEMILLWVRAKEVAHISAEIIRFRITNLLQIWQPRNTDRVTILSCQTIGVIYCYIRTNIIGKSHKTQIEFSCNHNHQNLVHTTADTSKWVYIPSHSIPYNNDEQPDFWKNDVRQNRYIATLL